MITPHAGAEARQEPTPCEACQGSGQEILGEHYVTRDMAIDAGEPGIEGMFFGCEYGPCSACGGTGIKEAQP